MNTADSPRFAWMFDAPSFIDAAQIERFYDAVIRPTHVEGVTSVTLGSSGEMSIGGEVSGEGKLKFGGGILKFLAGAGAEGTLGGKGAASKKDGTSESTATQWIPIHTPERQLRQIVQSFQQVAPDRLLDLGKAPSKEKIDSLYSVETARTGENRPRAIVVLELPSKPDASDRPTHLYPMAAELTDGTVVPLYERLREVMVGRLTKAIEEGDIGSLKKLLEPMLESDPKKIETSSAVREQMKWEQYASLYDPWDAMKILEVATFEKRLRWIDFQMSCGLTEGRHNIHLHICPSGQFDTGLFAYNFIFRSFGHGIRIVGTLKSGPDINVLAIYER